MRGDVCAAHCRITLQSSRPRTCLQRPPLPLPAAAHASVGQTAPVSMNDERQMRVRHPEARPSLTASVVPYIAATLAGLLTFALFAQPYIARAQTGRMYRVAMLESFSTEEGRPYRETFLTALRDLGYVEGRNLILDLRTSDRD